MENKEKITFSEAQETLLVPLACKSQKGSPLFYDEYASELMGRIDYDFSRLKIPAKTCMTLCLRAAQLDACAREFLAQQPDSTVIHLGCGLDSRFTRVDNRRVAWYDLDMPDVITLRKKFFAESERYRLIASNVTDLSWIEQIRDRSRPTLVLAEGLVMYLQEADVKALVLRLKERFSGCRLIFDTFSKTTARMANRHPSIQKTGAVLHFGMDDPAEMESWGEGIVFRSEWFFSDAAQIARLGWANQAVFKLAALFPAARRAHRILQYDLGIPASVGLETQG